VNVGVAYEALGDVAYCWSIYSRVKRLHAVFARKVLSWIGLVQRHLARAKSNLLKVLRFGNSSELDSTSRLSERSLTSLLVLMALDQLLKHAVKFTVTLLRADIKLADRV
jgi:hypothetical protein